MKVVWLCDLNLHEFADRLKIDKKIFQGQHPLTWITTLTNKFSHLYDVELHIITGSQFIKSPLSFCENEINYYILPLYHYPFPYNEQLKNKYGHFTVLFIRSLLIIPKRLNKLLRILDILTSYKYFTLRVKKIIAKINPDIIHSHGTESVYSIPLNYLDFPSIVMIQGLMSVIKNLNTSFKTKMQSKIERKVFCKQKNFIISNDFIKQIIYKINPKANFWEINYLIDYDIIDSLPEVKMNSDLVFAAAIDKAKGIEDLIDACRIVKNTLPGFTLKIIGYHSDEYSKYLKQKIVEYELDSNIKFIGYIPDRVKMLTEVKKSKITVLPTYNDTGPRSIWEAMYIGVAVIANNVGGLPEMIVNNESGLLVEKGNIPALAESIIELLHNDEKREYLIKNAKLSANNENNKNVVNEMLQAYSEVIECYNKKQLKL